MTAVCRRGFIGSAACFALAGCSTPRTASAETRLAAAMEEARRQLEHGAMRGAALGTDGLMAALGLCTFDPVESPMNVSCRFDVASITKPLVAAALARLAAEGKFDPYAPFTKYLPRHVLGSGCRLTSIDLATHSSGYENLDALDAGIGRYSDRSVFFRKCLAFRPEHARHWKYYYCCQNYIYLGFILEEITGRPLDVACRELVFDPLGMRETGWGPVEGLRSKVKVKGRNVANAEMLPIANTNVANCGLGIGIGNTGNNSNVVQQPSATVNTPNAIGEINDERARGCAFPIGNAGVFTTVGDLLKFTGDLASRARFPSAYYELLQRPAFRWEGKVRSFGFDLSPDPLLGAASTRAIRHSGFTGQTIFADPETGLSAVVLTSRNCPHKEGLANRNRILNRLIGG